MTQTTIPTFDIEGAIAQVESCKFECVAGPLENNVGYQSLKKHLVKLRDALRFYAEGEPCCTDGPCGDKSIGGDKPCKCEWPKCGEKQFPTWDAGRTSREAAETVWNPTQRQRLVLAALDRCPCGLTDHEIAAQCELPMAVIQPRRSELSKMTPAKVTDSGFRRRTPYGKMAVVWVLA
jgi:hypothetical protein